MGNPCVSQLGPFSLANRGCELPKFRVKLRAAGGGLYTFAHSRNCAKMPPVGLEPATLAPSAQTGTQFTNCAEGLSQICRKMTGDTCVPEMAPFRIKSRLSISQILGKIKGLWRRAEMMAKMGHP